MRNIILQTEQLFEAARDPEYRFLLIEPILSYGIGFGVVLFVVGFFLKHEKLQITGLVAAGLAALCFVPYMTARRETLPRIEQIYKLNSSDRGRLFAENTASWSSSTWIYTTMIIVVTATLIVGARRNQLGLGLSLVTLLIGLVAIQNSLWMHYLDASAAYPNLKSHRAPIEEITRRSQKSSHRFPEQNLPSEESYAAPVNSPSEKNRQIRPLR
jgi:hypothetical protein